MEPFVRTAGVFVGCFLALAGIGLMLRGPDPAWVGAIPGALGLTLVWISSRMGMKR